MNFDEVSSIQCSTFWRLSGRPHPCGRPAEGLQGPDLGPSAGVWCTEDALVGARAAAHSRHGSFHRQPRSRHYFGTKHYLDNLLIVQVLGITLYLGQVPKYLVSRTNCSLSESSCASKARSGSRPEGKERHCVCTCRADSAADLSRGIRDILDHLRLARTSSAHIAQVMTYALFSLSSYFLLPAVQLSYRIGQLRKIQPYQDNPATARLV